MANTRKRKTAPKADSEAADTPEIAETEPASAAEETGVPKPDEGTSAEPDGAAKADAGDGDEPQPEVEVVPSGTAEAGLDADATDAAAMPDAASAEEAGAPEDEASGEPVPPADRPEARPEPASATAPRRGGFFPGLLGGAIAAGLGLGAAVYILPDYLASPGQDEAIAALSADLESQGQRLTAMSGDIEAVAAEPAAQAAAEAQAAFASKTAADLDALGQTLAGISETLSGTTERLEALDARLAEIEKRPVEGGAASASALEAFGREMEALRAEMAAQQLDVKAAEDRVTAAAEAAAARINAAEEEAARLHEEAAEATRQSTIRAAVGRLRAAMETGGSLENGLADLAAAGVEAPAALVEQAQGVPTLAVLRDRFPPAAREAIAASLKETADGSTLDRIGAFLRSQSGARSLTPRAGDDPDAVLSRAEAALHSGDLAAAVAGISELPEAGQARLAEWVALANRHIAAAGALASLQSAME